MAPVFQKRSGRTSTQRLRIVIHGAVQGVGFRPFVFRLARELMLDGWVNNSSQGVFIEVEGHPDLLKTFLLRLPDEIPPRSFIQSLESSYLDAVGFTDFEIRESDEGGVKTAVVLPDVATCPDCIAEIFDPANRRYRYPFTNCTNCGPRFSIIETLPYDRPHTTMRWFEMCAACRAEYENAEDRRFHAQPNACPECGPHLELWNDQGEIVTSHHEALIEAAEVIRSGKIVAVKGLGGFHLVVDARDSRAVVELRRRKHREEKPFALMLPSMSSIEEFCDVSGLERRLLTSPESPIVLLRKKRATSAEPLSDFVAPANPYLGVLLPYTPLHHLLMGELGFPIVATSGNLSDEPICTDEKEAVERLRGIADLFLVHNRPIARHVDDSIVRVMMDREMLVRRARGFAPLPVITKSESEPTLAVGAHLKNSVALSTDHQIVISQHIGDLETDKAYGAFRDVIDSLERLYEVSPATVACDRHPDYMSTHWAAESHLKAIPVQHHYAHVLSCMAENELEPPALGVAWDGSGYGLDGTIWGGEFLRIKKAGFDRLAHFRTFRLPGGEQAIKEPRRSAIGLLYEIFGDGIFDILNLAPVAAFKPADRGVIRGMLDRNINSPLTSSAGRLFDAVASVIGVMQETRFEGQAAMQLEFMAEPDELSRYEFEVVCGMDEPLIIDWQPMFRDIIYDFARRVSPSRIAARFHNTLVEMIVKVATIAGEKSVALSGGCFQNKFLTERAITRLRAEGFNVYWHQRVPTNDGGISLGQLVAARENASGDPNAERRLENVCA
jgi:hydrogenase maturation protein HypF